MTTPAVPSCRDFRRDYTDWRDGHRPDLAERMEAHLAACARCAAHHKALAVGVGVLRELRRRMVT